MSLSKKRPTFLRFILCLFIGLLISVGILILLQPHYERAVGKSILREPFFVLAGISTLVIGLILFFPVRRPMWLLKWLSRLLVLVLLVALVFGLGGFYQAQNDSLYYPGRREPNAEAALAGNAQVRQLAVPLENGTESQGYLWTPTPGKAGLVLYLGGNGELAAARIHAMIRDGASNLLPGYHFMMVDYPGYGQSQGEPSEDSILMMARAAMNIASSLPEVDPARIVVAGYSLGTGPACMLAAENQLAGLILMAPYYSGSEIVNSYLQTSLGMKDGLFSRVPGFLVRNKYPSNEYAKGVTEKTLILAGKADTMVPYEQAERLQKEFPEALLISLEGGHSAPWTEATSFQALGAYLRNVSNLSQQETPAP